MRLLHYIRITCLCVLLSCSFSTIACECPEVQKLDKAYSDSYKLIFKGAVKSIEPCKEVGKVRFIVHELYKGDSPQEIDVYFDCSGDCAMNFNAGETWIIYANYAQLGKPDVSFCSRSRKQIDNEIQVQQDFVPTDLSFGQELEWLQTNLGTKNMLAVNNNADFSHRNELPTPKKTIILIVISFVAMMGLYLAIKKFMK
jgi:hypothetical protein